MKAIVRVCTRRRALVLVLGLLVGVTSSDGIRGQEGGMRWDGVIEHLSGPTDWGTYPNGAARMSRHPVSRDGRWVVFSADAPNGDPYPPSHLVFRRDRLTGESQALFGAQVLNPPVISSDGKHLAFQTCEPWVREDQAPICDVYVMDFTYWSLVNASTGVDGTLSDDASDDPVLSADGRYLLFRTRSTTLLPPGAAPGQLVLRDRDGNGNGIFDEPGEARLEVISVSTTGNAGNAESGSAEVSADGRFVAFRSRASNLVPGDTNNAWDVFLHDRWTRNTRRINVGWDGQQATPSVDSPAISMSADGEVIAFAADDAYITSAPHWYSDFNNALDVIVYEQSSNSLTRIDIGRNGELGNGHTYWPTLSETGQYVSLLSTATNVEAPVMPGRVRAYVYDRFARRATRVDLTPYGVDPNEDSSAPVISGDGSFVAFVSAAANLIIGQTPPPDAIYGAAHFAVTPETLTIPARGGEVTATITAQAYVKWSSDTYSWWLHWVTPSWGTGSGSATLTAYANFDPTPRTETVRLLGKTVVVTQEAGLSMTSVSPASGPMSGGTVVTITGTGFEPDMTVYFDGFEEAIPEFINSTTLRATTPAHGPGLVGVFLRTSDWRWTSLYEAFRYQDTTPPQITPFVSGERTNGWYTGDVTIDWWVQDPDSPITSYNGCAQTILTTDTNGTSVTCSATSEGGTASATTGTLRRDTTPPVIQILSPGPTMYARTPVRTANYTCTDAGSGVATCSGTVAHGAAISMTPGYNVFTVVAGDAAGNLGPKEVTYAVSNGACEARPFGLAAWWPFEVPYGSGAQFSYKDIVSGVEAVGVNTNWRAGQGAVGFFAMSTANPESYMQAGARTALERTDALTLSAWVFPGFQNSPASVIAGREGEYLIARFPDGTLRWSLANTSPGWSWVNTGHVIPTGLWSQVVLTYDGSAVKTYVNGLLVHYAPASGVIGDAAPALDDFRIGSRQEPGAPSYFVGGIDDLLLFNRALAPDEIQRVFLAGERGLCGPRSLYLTLTPNPLRVSYGTTQDVELVATLMHNSTPESGRTVTVTNYDQPIGSGVTDQNGEFRITTSVVGNWVGTSYRYEAHHQGDFYFATASAWQALITEKAVPLITWPAPAAIVYGTPLGVAQQNAQANTGGNFEYTPAAGTVLPAGTHTLSMAFTPWIPYNYTNTSATVTLDVTRATPTVQTAGGTFAYDGMPHGATGTVTGVGGASLSPLTFTYNGSPAVPVNAGTYAVVATFAGDANYDSASATGTLAINKATPAATAIGGTFTYDAAPHAATGSVTGLGGASLGPLTFTYNGSPDAPVNSGRYAVIASYAGDTNYHAASADAVVTIEKATPTASATGGTFTYDGAAHAATGSVTGVGGTSLGPLTFTYNGSSDTPVNAGSYAVLASYAGDVNYRDASATATLTIDRATPTVSATGGTSTFDGAAHSATGLVTGVGGASLGPLTFTYNGSSDAPVNAGSYAVVAGYAGDANYHAASGTATLTIDKATPTVSAAGGTFTYDGAAHGATGSVTGAGGASLGPLAFAYNGSPDAPVNAGSYAVVASYPGDENYNAATADATLTIDKATATVSATGGTFTYDAATHAATGSAIGVGGASLGPLTFTYNGSHDAPVNAGSYAVVATYAGDRDYAAASGTATLAIDKATPAVSATGGTFTYDGAAHGATGSVTGAGGASLGPITFTYNGSSDAPANAGSYAVVASYAGDANYHGASASTTVTIGKAAAVLQWVQPVAIVYGTALGQAQLNASSNVPGSFTYTPAAGTVLAAGTLRPLMATFTPADAANFNAGSVSTAIDIPPASLVIRANDAANRYGDPLPLFAATASGFVNGDSMASLGGTLGFTTTATAQSAVGTYPIVPSGLSSPNYIIWFVNGTLTVIRGAVIVAVSTSPEPSGHNQPMTFTATVAAAAAAAGAPGGSVRFFDGPALLGTASLNAGSASLTTAGLDFGTRPIEARYDGDASFELGTASSLHVIRNPSQTPVLSATSSRNPANAGENVTLTANVSMPSGPVTGSVQFYSGATLLATRTIGAGRATFTTNALAAGSHAITARYVGSGTAPPARSPVLVQAVGAAGWKNRSTTLTLSGAPNPSTLGANVALTATVTGSTSSMPSGRILFMLDGEVVGDPLGVAVMPVSGSTARVSLVLPGLAHGRRSVTATYRGDANYKGSTAQITQTVN